MGGFSKQGFPWGLLDGGGESCEIGGIAREMGQKRNNMPESAVLANLGKN